MADVDSPQQSGHVINPTIAALLGLVIMTSASLLIFFLMYNRRPKRFPPGPPSVPVLGSIPFLKHPSVEFYKEFTRLSHRYGGFFSLALGNTWVVVLNDFEIVKEALVGKSIEFAGRIEDPREKHFRVYWPIKGILTSSYSLEWRNQRYYAMNLLRSHGWGKKSMEQRIGEERDALLEELAVCSKRGPFQPGKLVNVSVTNVISSMLFGERFPYDDKQLNRLIHIINWLATFFAQSVERDYIPLLQLAPSYLKLIMTFRSVNNEIAEFIKRRINDRRQRIARNPTDPPRDFIESYLVGLKQQKEEATLAASAAELGENTENLEDSKRITQDWLHDIVSDILAAGLETTATTLNWALLYMVRWPAVQTKVQEELDRVLGKPRSYGLATLADRQKLPYTEATVMEVHRKAAIVATSIVHCTTKEVNFRGCTLPKGTQVRINLHGVLHDPVTWPDPDELKPERFLDESGSVIKHEQWIPFSMGRRMCMGEQLAKQEIFLLFSGILHSFRVHLPEGAPVPDDEPIPGIILKAKPFEICLSPRYE